MDWQIVTDKPWPTSFSVEFEKIKLTCMCLNVPKVTKHHSNSSKPSYINDFISFIRFTNLPPCKLKRPWKLNVTLGTGQRRDTGVKGQSAKSDCVLTFSYEDEHPGRLCPFKYARREARPHRSLDGCSQAAWTIKSFSFSACRGMCYICLGRNAPGWPPIETCR